MRWLDGTNATELYKNGYTGKFYVMYTVHTHKIFLTFCSKKVSENFAGKIRPYYKYLRTNTSNIM